MNGPIVVAVEDNFGERELLGLAVADASFAVELKVFESGKEALEYLHEEAISDSGRANRIALVLLDFNAAGLSGDKVVERLRADPKTRLVPVAILSGSAREADLRRAYEVGANAYLQKPVDFIEFTLLIRATIEFWCSNNRALLN